MYSTRLSCYTSRQIRSRDVEQIAPLRVALISIYMYQSKAQYTIVHMKIS